MTAVEDFTPRQKNLALITMIVAVVLEIVDLTIINTALPAIKADLGAGAEAAQWIVAGYSLSFALLLLTGGRLVFLINLPVGIMAIVSGWRFLPETRSAHPAGFDVPGTLLFALALLGLL